MEKNNKQRLKALPVKIFRFVVLLGLTYILLYPLFFMLSMAFRPLDQITDPTVVWIPKSLTMDNVIAVFGLMNFGTSFANTILIFGVSALIEVATCAVVGYGFARFKFPLKGLWFACVLLTILVPTQCITVPLTVQMRYFDFFGFGNIFAVFGEKLSVNLLNTPFALYIPSLFASGIRSGLLIFIYRQFFAGLPAELEDAAYIDGCGPFKTFVKVMLPISGGAVIIAFLLSLVAHWNDNLFTSFFFDNLDTLNSQLALIGTKAQGVLGGDGAYTLSTSYKQAGAMLFMAFPMLIYIIFQRKFTESIQTTGIVG